MYFQWKYIPKIFFFIIYTKTFLIALVRLTRKEILKCRKKQSFLASVPSNNIGYWLIESLLVVSKSLQPHGILQARILEWVAFPFSRGSSQPRDWIHISCKAGWFFFFFFFFLSFFFYFFIFTIWATGEAQEYWSGQPTLSPEALPKPGNEPGSTALQADSLLLSYQGSPLQLIKTLLNYLHHCWKCMNSSIKRLVRICRAILSFIDICLVL